MITKDTKPKEEYKYAIITLLKNNEYQYLYSTIEAIYNTPKEAYDYLNLRYSDITELSKEDQEMLPSVSYQSKFCWFIIQSINNSKIKIS